MSEAKPLEGSYFGPHLGFGFFGRAGGVSEGIYRGLNCGFGSGDEADKVAANRTRVARAMDIAPDQLLTVYQTHSTDVLAVTAAHIYAETPKADAMVTKECGLGLAILTADCAPILLVDEQAGVIGAAHAGWKGALGGILENVVGAMERLGAHDNTIRAIIGPTISQANYEVGPEFKARFLQDDGANTAFFAPSPRAKHWQFDLPGYCTRELERAGLEDIENLNMCTYDDEEQFFSYRRATHAQEPDYGRNISVIVLRP